MLGEWQSLEEGRRVAAAWFWPASLSMCQASGHLHDGMAAVWGGACCCPRLVPKQHKAERHGAPHFPAGLGSRELGGLGGAGREAGLLTDWRRYALLWRSGERGCPGMRGKWSVPPGNGGAFHFASDGFFAVCREDGKACHAPWLPYCPKFGLE